MTRDSKVLRSYAAGDPISTITARYEISTGTLYNILRRTNAPRRYRGGGPKNHAPVGTTSPTPEGYVVEKVAGDWPYAEAMCRWNGTWVDQHRKVMAEHLGRALLPGETVHHVNGDRSDNGIKNLQLRYGAHGKGVRLRCRCCGSDDVEAVPLGG